MRVRIPNRMGRECDRIIQVWMAQCNSIPTASKRICINASCSGCGWCFLCHFWCFILLSSIPLRSITWNDSSAYACAYACIVSSHSVPLNLGTNKIYFEIWHLHQHAQTHRIRDTTLTFCICFILDKCFHIWFRIVFSILSLYLLLCPLILPR